MTIIAVEDTGRLHLGYMERNAPSKELGLSIYTYDNCITKLYGWLSKNVTRIEVEGKTFWASRASYRKHLTSIGLNGVEGVDPRINKIVYKDLIDDHRASVRISGRPMTANLSVALREKLFVKLTEAVIKNDSDLAINLVRQGAYLDMPFYCNRGDVEFHWQNLNICLECYERTNISEHTPLTKAILNNNQRLALEIYYAKNRDVAGDQRCEYTVTGEKDRDGHLNPKSQLSENVVVTESVDEGSPPTLSLRSIVH